MRMFDKCPKCHDGRLVSQGTKRCKQRDRGEVKRMRYLKCDTCGHTGKEMISGSMQPRRRRGFPTVGTTERDLAKTGFTIETSCHAVADSKTKDNAMMYSIFKVAQRCSTDWQTIRDWLEEGVMPSPIIVGGWLRWRQSDLDAWVLNGCPRSAALSEKECSPLWDALLAELKALDEQNERTI